MAGDRLVRRALRERFLITLKSGVTFDGLLDDSDRNHLVFVDAHAYEDVAAGTGTGTQRTAVAGQLWIKRVEVDYMVHMAVGGGT